MNQNLYMNICPYEVEKTLKSFDMLKTKKTKKKKEKRRSVNKHRLLSAKKTPNSTYKTEKMT